MNSTLVPRMIEVGLKAPTWQFRDRETGPVATFDLSLLAGDTNHPYRVQCEQWKLMRFLEEKLRKEGVELRFGHEVTAVRQDDDGVTVTANTASGPVAVTGRYVIAADGARSAVRRSLGVEFEGFTYAELFLIASTDFPFENTLTDIAYVNYIADPLEWLVLLRVPGLWRVLVPAPENSDRDKLLSDDNLQAMLQRVVPRPEPYKIAHRSIYHVHQRVAKSFRHGRVLLAGDAAHVNNPLGGMGMNGGIQDAFNLADKLKAIWAGADDRLLDRYDRQRRTVAVEAVQQQTHRNQQIISERDPGDAEEIARRDAEGRGGQDIGARIHAAVVDDRQHAAGGGDRVTFPVLILRSGQVEHAGNDAPLVRADIRHDGGVVGRLEQRIAGGDDDDGGDVAGDAERRRHHGQNEANRPPFR